MSDTTVSGFFERLDSDKELAGAYTAAVTRAVRTAVWPAIAEVAAKKGFAFSPEELGTWLAERQAELSDEALEGVAGGILKGPRPISGWLGWVPVAAVGTVVVAGVADSGSDGGSREPISP